MDLPPQQIFPPALAAWHESLRAYLGAINDYVREAKGPSAGRAWLVANQLVSNAEEMAKVRPEGLDDDPSPAELMAASDGVENAMRAIRAAADAALDPNVQSSATSGMSRTYSENLKGLAERVREAAREAASRLEAARDAAAVAGAASRARNVGAVTAAYRERDGRGGIATEFYVHALRCSGGGAAALRALDEAKGSALAAAEDSPAAAAADTEALAEYHPLQAMTYMPVAMTRSDTAAACSDTAAACPDTAAACPDTVDLSLPQGRISVVYNIAPLIDRRRAIEYGPLANIAVGLNHRLIERLRTIHAEPFKPEVHSRGTTARCRAAVAHGPVAVTIDGRTVLELAAPGKADWAPFGGSPPRVEANSEAEATLILAGIRADRALGWGLDLRQQYEAAIEGGRIPKGECAEAAILSALITEFERAYDNDPPKSPGDFHRLVVAKEANPGDYIHAALSRHGSDVVDGRLRALHMRPAMARAPYAMIERESRMTQMVHTIATGNTLWKRFKKYYWHPDPAEFDRPAGQKKASLMHEFRRIAAAAVRETPPLECSPPTLKLFAVAAAGV